MVAIPADGVTLREFGFKNGPLDQFSVPRTTYLFSSADQPNNVTLIASFPSADDLLAYLRTSLPATGFTITADDPAVSTLTFTGHGWSGTVTAAPGHPTPGTTAATLAITLRPL